jgi:hypothetical protein
MRSGPLETWELAAGAETGDGLARASSDSNSVPGIRAGRLMMLLLITPLAIWSELQVTGLERRRGRPSACAQLTMCSSGRRPAARKGCQNCGCVAPRSSAACQCRQSIRASSCPLWQSSVANNRSLACGWQSTGRQRLEERVAVGAQKASGDPRW